MVWAPLGCAAAAWKWWPPGVEEVPSAGSALADTVRLGTGAAVSYGAGAVDAHWRDGGWPPTVGDPVVSITATPKDLRISVPPLWRAHVYFGWRDGYLLASSDLRSTADAVGATRPSRPGVAAFLAGGHPGAGVTPSLYQDVWDLHPGHSLVVHPDTSTSCTRTWTPERAAEFDAQPLTVVTDRLRDHLDELADRLLSRHRRIACLFSGGLDSSLVAATLLRRAPRRVVLFNVGSGLGTVAEAALRARFLHDFDAVSHPVDLPPDAGLLRSLRATNARAALPTGSLFSHVFEEIISAALARDCDAVVTGDGGDEVFAEREEVLVDLLARRSAALPAAAGFFALRNEERAALTIRRAARRLRALNHGTVPAIGPQPGDILFGTELARLVSEARRQDRVHARQWWEAGWTCSGLESYRRATAVPSWEPVSADAPAFPVVSPLADATILGDALALRREAVVPTMYGAQRKWLLRQAALEWLSAEVALHPKIGSADGQILVHTRTNEFADLMGLLDSGTAHRLGLRLPATAEDPDSPLWSGDGWIKSAALVAWFEQASVSPRRRPVITATATTSPPEEALPAPTRPGPRPRWWQVGTLAALNVAAQLTPLARMRRRRTPLAASPRLAVDAELTRSLAHLARRACAIPLVSGSSRTMSRSLAWYLRLGGKRPTVVRGVAQGQRGQRYWIEVDGSVVDVHGAETPLLADPR